MFFLFIYTWFIYLLILFLMLLFICFLLIVGCQESGSQWVHQLFRFMKDPLLQCFGRTRYVYIYTYMHIHDTYPY